LRQRVVQGEFTPRTMLPGEAELSTEYGVSRNTLRRALTELEVERLIAVCCRDAGASSPNRGIRKVVRRAWG
jgi:DNA-binding FadR family transcriptional regulator